MADFDMAVSRLGQVNGAGDTDALFLKVFGGEVLTAFNENNVAMSRHTVRTITHGKSASFPATWKGTARYHVPGTLIVGTGVNANERVLVIDDLLIADRAIAQIDEAKNHYDVRSIYSRDIGMALARTFDKNVLQVMVLAARAAATVTGGNGGTELTSFTITTPTVAEMEAGAFASAQALDEKDVSDQERYLFLRPAEYYRLVSGSSKVINSDYNPGVMNGNYATGKFFQIAGLEVVKTNNLPNTNVTTGPAAYRGDYSKICGLVCNRSAVGTVKLIDLSTEMEWKMEYQATLLIGKYAVGHGILRPECAVSWKTA